MKTIFNLYILTDGSFFPSNSTEKILPELLSSLNVIED